MTFVNYHVMSTQTEQAAIQADRQNIQASHICGAHSGSPLIQSFYVQGIYNVVNAYLHTLTSINYNPFY